VLFDRWPPIETRDTFARAGREEEGRNFTTRTAVVPSEAAVFLRARPGEVDPRPFICLALGAMVLIAGSLLVLALALVRRVGRWPVPAPDTRDGRIILYVALTPWLLIPAVVFLVYCFIPDVRPGGAP
jgi:hypothetical protein